MKNLFKSLILLSFSALILVSCVNDDDFALPTMRPSLFSERFQNVTTNTNLDLEGWTNFAEEGTWVWREKTFYSSNASTNNGFNTNGYTEFSAYNSNSASNVVWLITPEINMVTAQKPRLLFKCAQHHLDVDAPENSLEVLYSTDYDGTDVLTATWKPISGLNLPTKDTSWYEFLSTDVALPTGSNLYVAFKFRGSGTNTSYDGAFQVDDVFVYNQN